MGRPRARGRGFGREAAAAYGPDLRRELRTQRRARALPVALGDLRSPRSLPGRRREQRAAGARGGAGGGGQCETG